MVEYSYQSQPNPPGSRPDLSPNAHISSQADWYSFGASAFLLFSGCIPPPEHPREYEMDRTDIAPEDQRFILALVFGTLSTIDEVLRSEWFNQGSVPQSRLSSQFAFQCCNVMQLLNSPQRIPFYLYSKNRL